VDPDFFAKAFRVYWNAGYPVHVNDPARTMVNLLGAARYEGAHLHLYGKAMTKPFRKMGHITALADTREAALEKAALAKSLLRAVSG
jgi:phosphoribosylaminoimidazole carboxylase (NCAIR synthetase)